MPVRFKSDVLRREPATLLAKLFPYSATALRHVGSLQEPRNDNDPLRTGTHYLIEIARFDPANAENGDLPPGGLLHLGNTFEPDAWAPLLGRGRKKGPEPDVGRALSQGRPCLGGGMG